MRRWLIAGGVVLVVLVGLMFALPAIIKKIVETKQANMPGGYQAKLDHVEVRGLGSEIALVGFHIVKKNGLVPVPFLQTKEFSLLTEREGWKLRTVMRYVNPEFSWVDAESEAKKQLGPQDVINTLREQLPFELTRVEVIDGIGHFRNFQTKPDMDIYAHHLNVRWENLFGCLPPGNSACRSNLRATAKVMKSGDLKLKGRFARNPVNDFHVTAHLRDLRASELNPFLQQYVKIKASKGEIALDARYDRHGERHDALMVPLLDDIEVEKAEGEDKSFLRKIGAGIATGWFERKKGEKGIAITKKPNGATDFEIVDKPDVHDPKDAKADDD
ncbi:MAG TPA: DUF748 domain-containing protein [Polyangiales bacterium]|nr:DUF748 domain-containing protein [Polyangiales bacterium]